MKPLPLIALNLAVVALALVAYDQLRGGSVATIASSPGSAARDDQIDDAFEERLRALEGNRPRVRRSSGTDPDVLARLDALEAALGAPAAVDPVLATDESTDSGVSHAATPRVPRGEPTAAEIKRFRQLREAIRREESVEKNRKRIDAVLTALPVNLTDAEREGVHRAYAAFQPRVGEIWGETKAEAQRTIAAGGDVDRATLVADTTAVIQQELAEALSSVISPVDAQTVSGALLDRGK